MQLKRLKINKFVGIDDAEVTFEKGVSLFVGRNNQGKSSIKDAVLFAQTGKCRAMRFNKEVGHVMRGTDGMLVELDYVDGNGEERSVKRTKSSVGANVDDSEVLRYCLNPAEFIGLPAKERGKVLSDVLGGGMDDLVKGAIVEHIGDIDKTLLAEVKGSGVNILDLDAFREQIVEQRRSYKRLIEELPDKVPLLGDYDLENEYDVTKDEADVKKLADRIAKGNEIIGEANAMLQLKAQVADLRRDLRHLQEQKKAVPKLPRGVDQNALNLAPVYLSIQETMLKDEAKEPHSCLCPVCNSQSARVALLQIHNDLAKWYEKYREKVAERNYAIEQNEELERQYEVKGKLLQEIQAKVHDVPMPDGAEGLLEKLIAERDAAQARIANYQRFEEAAKAFAEAGIRRQKLEKLIAECNRIDEALKDGGPVKAAIAAGGRKLPINESLLRLWDMDELAWSDNGEITLRGLPIEYASDSERYRVACVMGLALADVSGIGIAALDGFEVLDPNNANAFFEAITECKINNAIICCSTTKDYSHINVPEWLEIFKVENGLLRRIQ